jgi:hypothetical protein
MNRRLTIVAAVSILLSHGGCARKDRVATRILGSWERYSRDTGKHRQTQWSAPCRAEYHPDGTSYYTEDNIEEWGKYTVSESESAILEEVTASGVKERVGTRSRGIVWFVADQMTIRYERDAQGRQTTLTYLRPSGLATHHDGK